MMDCKKALAATDGDMDKAVDILREKIAEQKRIRVIGDYDIDGVCSTYLLYRGLTRCGADVDYQIPERIRDGYGINESIIRKAKEEGIHTVLDTSGSPFTRETPFFADFEKLMKVTDRLIAKGMEQTVALITDGRFSGFNHGTIIGHVAPEAMAGGLIAFVEDGDIITYSSPEGILQLEVTEDVIAERKQRWKKPEPKIKSGVLALYGATCRPASEGAAMQNW